MSEQKFTRPQQQAIDALTGNVFVSAGAGSGKTRVMVERFLKLLAAQRSLADKKVSPANLVAITFTKKAAGELKERIRAGIAERVAEEPQYKDFWLKQQQTLDQAQIGTIHGLCARLLREQAAVLGLDPDFQTADETESAVFLCDCLNEFFAENYKEAEPDLALLVNAYGGKQVKENLKALLSKVEEIAAWGDLSEPYRKNIRESEALYETVFGELKGVVARKDDFKKTKGEEFLAVIAEELPILAQSLVVAHDFAPLKKLLGSAPDGRTKVGKALKPAREQLERLETAEADKIALPLVDAYKNVLKNLAAFTAAAKAQRGLVGYDDLEEQALGLLRQHPEVRGYYQKLFTHIMVDEFQDTNARQKSIIYLLCGDDEDRLQNGKLFTVGDPKQSIYRFRGADVGVFAGVRREIEEEKKGELVSMDDNFRSSKEVLAAVDEAFAALLGTDESEAVFFEPLEGHFTSNERPRFLHIDIGEEKNAALLEARAVARELKELLARPYHLTYEDGREEEKAADLGKIAVLLPRFTHVDEIKEAFREEGLPFLVYNGHGFYQRQEVADILSLCRGLLHKYENLPLAGALRSPYFGLDDATLTRLFLAVPQHGSLRETLLKADTADFNAEQRPLVARAQRLVKELTAAAALWGPREFFRELMRALKTEAVLGAQVGGRQQLANVKKLGRLLFAFAAETGGSLADFIAHTEQLTAFGNLETEANLEAPAAASVMTVHGAKGLEFDTVILPQLSGKGNADKSSVRFSPTLGLGVQAPLDDGSTKDTGVLKALKEENSLLQQKEDLRLLYVAMTRAKYRLILAGTFKDGKKSEARNWYNLLNDPAVLGSSDDVEHVKLEAKEYKEESSSETINAAAEESEENLAAPLALPQKSVSSFTPTAIAAYLVCPRRYFYHYVAKLPEEEAVFPKGKGKSKALPPVLLGSVIHRSLELLHLKAGTSEKERELKVAESYARALREEAPDFIGSEAAAAGEKLLQDYAAGELFAKLPEERQRELQLQWWEDDLRFTGIIDCLYEDENGQHIVDFKSGRPPAEEGLPLAYAYQLALYARGAAKLFGHKKIDGSLHFLREEGKDRGCGGEELAAYGEEAVSLARRISGKKAEEAAFAPAIGSRYCPYCSYNYLCPAASHPKEEADGEELCSRKIRQGGEL